MNKMNPDILQKARSITDRYFEDCGWFWFYNLLEVDEIHARAGLEGIFPIKQTYDNTISFSKVFDNFPINDCLHTSFNEIMKNLGIVSFDNFIISEDPDYQDTTSQIFYFSISLTINVELFLQNYIKEELTGEFSFPTPLEIVGAINDWPRK